MDRQNFENQTFNELPERIICSNFENCTFNVKTTFERCNLLKCIFNVQCEFDRSNVIDEDLDEPTEESDKEVTYLA